MKFPEYPDLKSSRGWTRLTASSLITIFAALFCLQQQCQAQGKLERLDSQFTPKTDYQPESQPDMSVNPLKFVYWHSGPQKVSLGNFADINIPAGYHLTDVHGARNILKTFNNPIPKDLVGILAPVNGRWLAILEYAPDGYVKSPDFAQVNTKAVLNQVLNQLTKEQGQSLITSLSWQSQPTYDARTHVLQWSFQIVTPSAKILDQAAAVFGRHGVFQITVAHSASFTGASGLKQLISDVSFKDGERYAEYKKGDKIAQIGLADLISGENHPQTAGFFSGEIETDLPWIYGGYGGLAFCLLTGRVVATRRRNKVRRCRAQAPVPAPAIMNKPPVKTAIPSPPPVTAKSESNKNSQPIAQPQPKPTSDVGNGVTPWNRNNRNQGIRMFDYQKFYTDVVRQLSHHSCVQPRMVTGKAIFINHAKLHRAQKTNGKPQII